MTTIADRQKFIRFWQDQTGETEIDLSRVSELALRMGWEAPPPTSSIERLAKQFKQAARQDVRRDRKTGHPYRGYHAVPRGTVEGQLSFFYVDIDDPKTKPENFRKACVLRREQAVDDMLALFYDQTHWNASRPNEQRLELLPSDLEPDVQWRVASEDDEPKAA